MKKGDRVAVQTQKTADCLMLYLAWLRAGALYLPLNTADTLTEIAYFSGDAEPRLFVCDPANHDSFAGELAAFKRPKRIIAVDALPRNAMGKNQRNALRDRYRDLYAAL